MVMRISDNMKFNTIVNNLFRVQDSYNGLMEKMSSQKKINRPSDDPIGMSRVLDLRTYKASIAQYRQNIDSSRPWIETTESNLSSADNLLVKAHEIAIAQSTATASAETRSISAQSVQQIIDGMLSLANSKYGDRYLFAGTEIDKKPFSSSDYSYNGNSKNFSVEIGKDESFDYSIPGASVFTDMDKANGGGTVDIFKVLKDLKDSLENNDPNGIAAQLDKLTHASDQINKYIAKCGTKMNRLEMAKNNMADMDFNLTKMISNTEDVDFSKIATKLAMEEITLKASYETASKIGNLTILDFLR
ncbi:MAG: flagellar hook-associated protein 3 [Nitrospiraceae bacterium]|nr:flagellar hook-associated protein 3 [Nitrospiraceae bacterium]